MKRSTLVPISGSDTRNQDSYTIQEVAEMLNKHRATIARWLRDGKLEAHDLGEGFKPRYYIPHSEIAPHLKAQGVVS